MRKLRIISNNVMIPINNVILFLSFMITLPLFFYFLLSSCYQKKKISFSGLKRIENGFDITTRTGGFLIRADYEIETTSTIEQTWNIEVTLVNLDSDQNINMGKTLNGRFYITTDQNLKY